MRLEACQFSDLGSVEVRGKRGGGGGGGSWTQNRHGMENRKLNLNLLTF